MRRALLAPLTALAVAIPAVAGAAAPTISITSPAPGTTFSRSASPTIAVTGSAGFDEPLPAERTFFLRGTGCGATENFWLSTESGTDEYDGCGIIGGLPAQEVFQEASVFPAEDGVPVVIDASKEVSGTIRAESWFGDGIPGAGQVVVDVTLTGVTDADQSVTLGSDSVEQMNTGSDGIQVDFSFGLDDGIDRTTLTSLALSVLVRGVNWNSGNLGLSGDSSFDLPIYDAGRVDVSSDSAIFSPGKTVQAVLEPDGTWSAEIATPVTGSRTIYARAVQAGATTNATPVPIVVTS